MSSLRKAFVVMLTAVGRHQWLQRRQKSRLRDRRWFWMKFQEIRKVSGCGSSGDVDDTDSCIAAMAAMTVMHEDCHAQDFVDRGEAAGVTTGGFGGSREGSGGEGGLRRRRQQRR